MVSDADGAVVAVAAALKLANMAVRGDVLRGDVIVSYAGQPVKEVRDLPRAVSLTSVGDRVEVEVLRDGKRKAFDVKIGRLQEDEPKLAMKARKKGLASVGLQVQDAPGGAGARVAQVAPGSPADQAGLRPGDVIVEANRSEIGSGCTSARSRTRAATLACIGSRRTAG